MRGACAGERVAGGRVAGTGAAAGGTVGNGGTAGGCNSDPRCWTVSRIRVPNLRTTPCAEASSADNAMPNATAQMAKINLAEDRLAGR